MAKIVSSVSQEVVPTASPITLLQPEDVQVGDVLYLVVFARNGNVSIEPTGFSSITGSFSVSITRLYKVVTELNINEVIQSAARVGQGFCYVMQTIRGVGLDLPGVPKFTYVTGTLAPPPSGYTRDGLSITTTTNNTLVVHDCITDSRVLLVESRHGNIVRQVGFYACVLVCSNPQVVAGVTPVIKIHGKLSQTLGSVFYMAVAFEDDGTGDYLQIDGRQTDTHVYTYDYPPVVTRVVGNTYPWFATVAGLTVLSGVTLSGDGANSTFLGEGAAGQWLTVSTMDLSNGHLHCRVVGGSLHVRNGIHGVFITVADSLGNWAAYKIFLAGQIGNSIIFEISVEVASAERLDQSAVLPDFTDITYIGAFFHRLSADTGLAGLAFTTAYHFKENSVFTGGGAESRLSLPEMVEHLNGPLLNSSATVSGSKQIGMNRPIQIGDGTTRTVCNLFGCSMESPIDFKLTNEPGNKLFNVQNNASDLTVFACDMDVIYLRSAILAANIRSDFTIHPESSLLAEYNFSGTTFSGYDVTWKTGIPCALATFAGCYDNDFKGADLDTVTIINPRSTACLMMTESGATLDTCLLDVTGTTADYLIELGAAVTSITLADVDFVGTPVVDKVHVMATTGTVTITTSGTTTLLAGDVTSDGATVVIASPQLTLTIAANTSLVGAEVRLYDLDNVPAGSYGTELAGVESCLTSTFDYIGTAGNLINIQIMQDGYKEYNQEYTITGSSTTLSVRLIPDTNE